MLEHVKDNDSRIRNARYVVANKEYGITIDWNTGQARQATRVQRERKRARERILLLS